MIITPLSRGLPFMVSTFMAETVFAQSSTTSDSPSGMLLQTLLSFALVVGALGLFAWWMKRAKHLLPGSKVPLKVISQLTLSTREKVLVIEFQNDWLVVGSTGQQMTLLANVPKPEETDLGNKGSAAEIGRTEPENQTQKRFQRALQRAMGQKSEIADSNHARDQDPA